jgi:hypothetical protein
VEILRPLRAGLRRFASGVGTFEMLVSDAAGFPNRRIVAARDDVADGGPQGAGLPERRSSFCKLRRPERARGVVRDPGIEPAACLRRGLALDRFSNCCSPTQARSVGEQRLPAPLVLRVDEHLTPLVEAREPAVDPEGLRHCRFDVAQRCVRDGVAKRLFRIVSWLGAVECHQPVLRLAVCGARLRQLCGADAPRMRGAIVDPEVVAIASGDRDHMRPGADERFRQPGPRQRRVGDAERRLSVGEHRIERLARAAGPSFACRHLDSDPRQALGDVRVWHRTAAQGQRQHRWPSLLEHAA